jgi:hypothetical protein
MTNDDLVGRRVHIPARNETRGTPSGIYEGTILKRLGENFLVELIAPDGRCHTTLMPVDSFACGKTPPPVWVQPGPLFRQRGKE